MHCARDATPLAEEVTGSKGPISLALGSWRWGGGYGGGEGWGLAFFKSMCSADSPCGIKRPTISKF
jgi:hypothetical protein